MTLLLILAGSYFFIRYVRFPFAGIATLLLIGAFLIVSSVRHLREVAPGFTPRGVLAGGSISRPCAIRPGRH